MDPRSTLLIIEDEQDIRDILLEELKFLPINLLTATDGQSALEIIESGSYRLDAILSDISMPKMTGLQLLRSLREKNIEIPFVFLTAYGDKGKVIEALKLGALDFLEKPYERSDLINAVETACQLGKASRELDEELVDLAEKDRLPAEHREIKKKLLMLQRMSRIYRKKVG